MDLPLGKGVFLVATPSLRDPNFRQTVVLLCEYGPDGALGVVVNRPTEISITEVLPQIPVLEGHNHVVFSGGPVQRNHLLILYRLYRLTEEPTDTHHIFDGVYLVGNMDALERIIKYPNPQQNFRAFMGYSGWEPGQLENEMKTRSWLTIPADSVSMFERDHTQLWPNILRSLGEPYDFYANMPMDPSLN